MASTLIPLGRFIRQRIAAEPLSVNTEAERALTISLQSVLETLAEAMVSQNLEPMVAHANSVGVRRAQAGHPLTDAMSSFMSIRALVWDNLRAYVAQAGPWELESYEALELLLHRYRNAFLGGFSETYQQIDRAMAAQAEELEAQRSTISEIGTPILPLYEGIIVLPLVGALDSRRATQVMERLLEAISEQQADIAIIDITGVPVVDTGVANYLMQAARAAQLIGAEVLLVGIGAEVAQVLVQLGVDLGNVTVCANLQAGITQALAKIGKQIS
jgi:rsbT co-antagonist protein RsbR